MLKKAIVLITLGVINLSFATHATELENQLAFERQIPIDSATGESQKSGIQIFQNKTDKTITIGVGNFWPTEYILAPGQEKWVVVSTDNQTVEITSVQ